MLNADRRIDWVWARDAAIASLLFSAFLGLIGPLGDYGVVPTETRILAWTVLGLLGFGVYATTLVALRRVWRRGPWAAILGATAILGAIPLTPIVAVVDRAITGDETSAWLPTYLTLLPIGAAYLVVFDVVRRARLRSAATAPTAQDSGDAPAARFLRRLPAELRGDLLCLAKEDHYLRVYTTAGDALIRLRMSDAVAELDAVAGLQTHRSWWVADDAVTSARRKAAGGGEAMLRNGVVAPIARARLAEAQAAGWFERA
ncbi:MAG: LytTR family DNA-binding domain-containing protein [Pseudomonadota bacterium]